MLKHTTWITNARTRLIAIGLAAGDVRADDEMPGTDAELPYALVAIGGDVARPDGEPRTGYPKFKHETTLAVMAVDHANTGAELKTKLAQHSEKIFAALCSDIDGWTAGLLEGIDQITTTYELPPKGEENIGRVIVAFQLLSRSHWPSADEDLSDLADVRVTAGNGITGNFDVPTE